MKKLSISEIFFGYSDIVFPDNLDYSKSVEPRVTLSDDNKDVVLFLTDKVSGETDTVDLSGINSMPYAVVISKNRKIFPTSAHVIRVADVRAALSYSLSNFYEINHNKLKFIGVTGTNGKTTTATLIYEILRRSGYNVGFIGTGKILSNDNLLSGQTYSMTTPDATVLYPSIAKMQEVGCEYIVMEVSSHGIALGRIAPIKFEYAIFTNLDSDHLDFHKSREDYFSVKLKLFESCKKGLFNLDDDYVKKAYDSVKCQKSSFAVLNTADAEATGICEQGLSGTSFFYREKDTIFKVRSNLIGRFNVYNALASLKCVIDLGLKPCIAKKGIESIEGVDGRMETLKNDIMAIIDYAHTPAAFENVLRTIKSSIDEQSKLIVVFGCGGDRDPTKRPVFGYFAELLADSIIITEDNSRGESFTDIARCITAGIKNKHFDVIPDRESAIRYAFKIAKRGDTVAIIGKGHEKYKICGSEYLPFDEREIILDCLKKRTI